MLATAATARPSRSKTGVAVAAGVAAASGALFPFFWGTGVYGWLEFVALGTPMVWLALCAPGFDRVATVEQWQRTERRG
jgi:hypothetical protein